MLGQVVDELPPHDVVGQLSVLLLLLFLPLSTLNELGVGPAGGTERRVMGILTGTVFLWSAPPLRKTDPCDVIRGTNVSQSLVMTTIVRRGFCLCFFFFVTKASVLARSRMPRFYWKAVDGRLFFFFFTFSNGNRLKNKDMQKGLINGLKNIHT